MVWMINYPRSNIAIVSFGSFLDRRSWFVLKKSCVEDVELWVHEFTERAIKYTLKEWGYITSNDFSLLAHRLALEHEKDGEEFERKYCFSLLDLLSYGR